MLERVVKFKKPLIISIISIKRVPINLDPDEWIIVDVLQLLKLFENMVIELFVKQYPTIAKLIPLIRGNYLNTI